MARREEPLFDITSEERLLQEIVDEVLVETRPSIRLAVTVALSRKEFERAASVIKAAVTKVLVKRK